MSSVNLLTAIPLSAAPLKCVSMNNREFKVRPEIVNVNSNEHFNAFYPFVGAVAIISIIHM